MKEWVFRLHGARQLFYGFISDNCTDLRCAKVDDVIKIRQGRGLLRILYDLHSGVYECLDLWGQEETQTGHSSLKPQKINILNFKLTFHDLFQQDKSKQLHRMLTRQASASIKVISKHFSSKHECYLRTLRVYEEKQKGKSAKCD